MTESSELMLVQWTPPQPTPSYLVVVGGVGGRPQGLLWLVQRGKRGPERRRRCLFSSRRGVRVGAVSGGVVGGNG